MQTNNCDICEKQTFINPAREAQWVEEDLVIKTKNEQGEDVEVTVPQKSPMMTSYKSQNPFTGVIEDRQVQKFVDLQERTYYLQLTLGGETVARDVCRACLEEHILPLARPLWDKLAALIQKE